LGGYPSQEKGGKTLFFGRGGDSKKRKDQFPSTERRKKEERGLSHSLKRGGRKTTYCLTFWTGKKAMFRLKSYSRKKSGLNSPSRRKRRGKTGRHGSATDKGKKRGKKKERASGRPPQPQEGGGDPPRLRAEDRKNDEEKDIPSTSSARREEKKKKRERVHPPAKEGENGFRKKREKGELARRHREGKKEGESRFANPLHARKEEEEERVEKRDPSLRTTTSF